ncbi:Hint domain-containing protein [Sagittula sp. SSi028]|uniref:Hint domain-containing protein n=1 Tax=Sagittula sp. SSi028 TaxID=3400636 RepID=UPI003AF70E65
MAQSIFGDGVEVVSATYYGDNRASGIYSDGLDTMAGVAPSDEGVILSTGRAADITNRTNANSNNSNQSTNTGTNNRGYDNVDSFNDAAGARTYDIAALDVTFIPDGDQMTMQFVFLSEEYPEFQDSLYQDFVGVWVNGVQVELTVGDGDVDPRNLNNGSNENLYVDNTADQYNTEMDGFTVTMTLSFPVVAGEENNIRFGIADVSDANYDSNLLIAADSVQTVLVAGHDTADVFVGGQTTIDVLDNDYDATGGTLTITHVNGQAVTSGSVVTLSTGQQVQVNADGTLTVLADGDEESVNFTYTISNGNGNTDTGFITVNQVPCFVAGTMIETPDGARPVHLLEAGDLVMTRDNGPQPVRWAGRRVVAAKGSLAPIRIAAGALGDHDTVMVSPQHRVLVQDMLAHLMFEEPEVLAAAKHLINDGSIRRVEGREVEYVHILFDQHEIIRANGLLSESFLPGGEVANIFEQETLDEICEIFPELNVETGEGYGPPARRILKAYEAAAIKECAA